MYQTSTPVWQGIGKGWVPVLMAVCCLLSISQRAVAKAGDTSRRAYNPQSQSSPVAIPDAQFAVGDFDGDRQPDLATVEFVRFNSLRSRYWISFQLSKGRLQTIGVTAPAGGLVPLARDVNGDRALDLVLVTAWRHELVAVLLNDGEGNFAAADASQFEINALSSATRVGAVPGAAEDRMVLSLPYWALGDNRAGSFSAQESASAFPRAPDLALSLLPSAFSGRAPPRSSL